MQVILTKISMVVFRNHFHGMESYRPKCEKVIEPFSPFGIFTYQDESFMRVPNVHLLLIVNYFKDVRLSARLFVCECNVCTKQIVFCKPFMNTESTCTQVGIEMDQIGQRACLQCKIK